MANQDNIDKTSEQIALLVDKARAEIVVSLYAIGKNVEDVDAFIDALLAMDINGTLKVNEDLFDSAIIRTISGHIKTQVAQGLQSGLTAKQITEGLIDSSISVRQMQTVVNTTLNTYSRMATNQMMGTAPANTLYNYIGPADGRTRDICLQMISAGRITESEIISNFGTSVLKDGGGFNCRHKWDKAPIEQSAFHETKQAEKQIEERKPNA